LLRTLGAELVIAGPGSLAPAALAAEFGVDAGAGPRRGAAGVHVAMMLRIQRERLAAEVSLPELASEAAYHAAWGLTSAAWGGWTRTGWCCIPGR
jgi:aspartate carbamoyltransferase catalytic subunit